MDGNKLAELLKGREFISVATCNLEAHPNAAPKFLLKLEGNFIYLVDYTIGKTFRNLSVNPYASLSFTDTSSLTGYQINGRVELIDSGKEYDQIVKELRQKEMDLSIKRIVEGVVKGHSHKNFEVAIPEQFVIIKIKIEEIAEIGPGGTLKRERV